MTNHPNRAGKFELVFSGAAFARIPRHRRWHKTEDAAREEAARVLAEIDNRAAHPGIIYGPGLGKDGVTLT
jgi:hypothetical protein